MAGGHLKKKYVEVGQRFLPFAALFIAFLTVSLKFGSVFDHDAHTYLDFAQSIVESGKYQSKLIISDDTPFAWRPPLQFLAVATGLWLGLEYNKWILIFDFVLLFALCWLSAKSLRNISPEKHLPSRAWFAFILLGTPDFWSLMLSANSEPLFLLLFFMIIYQLSSQERRARFSAPALAIISSIGFLTRYIFVSCLGAILTGYLFDKRYKAFLGTLSAFFASAIPWLLISESKNPGSILGRRPDYYFDPEYFVFSLKQSLADFFLYLPSQDKKFFLAILGGLIFFFLSAHLAFACLAPSAPKRKAALRFIFTFVLMHITLVTIDCIYFEPGSGLWNRHFFPIAVPLYFSGSIILAELSIKLLWKTLLSAFLLLRVLDTAYYAVPNFNYYEPYTQNSIHKTLAQIHGQSSNKICVISRYRNFFADTSRYRLLQPRRMGDESGLGIEDYVEKLKAAGFNSCYFAQNPAAEGRDKKASFHYFVADPIYSPEDFKSAVKGSRLSLVSKDSDWVIHRLEF